MKKASLRELHIRTSELVRAAAEGDVITIERRGEPGGGVAANPTKRQQEDSGFRRLIPVTESFLRRVSTFVSAAPPSVFLRAGDAVHLTTAQDQGEPEIWTNDRHLLAAAAHFGLVGRSV